VARVSGAVFRDSSSITECSSKPLCVSITPGRSSGKRFRAGNGPPLARSGRLQAGDRPPLVLSRDDCRPGTVPLWLRSLSGCAARGGVFVFAPVVALLRSGRTRRATLLAGRALLSIVASRRSWWVPHQSVKRPTRGDDDGVESCKLIWNATGPGNRSS
jgi:hypothetical protein